MEEARGAEPYLIAYFVVFWGNIRTVQSLYKVSWYGLLIFQAIEWYDFPTPSSIKMLGRIFQARVNTVYGHCSNMLIRLRQCMRSSALLLNQDK